MRERREKKARLKRKSGAQGGEGDESGAGAKWKRSLAYLSWYCKPPLLSIFHPSDSGGSSGVFLVFVQAACNCSEDRHTSPLLAVTELNTEPPPFLVQALNHTVTSAETVAFRVVQDMLCVSNGGQATEYVMARTFHFDRLAVSTGLAACARLHLSCIPRCKHPIGSVIRGIARAVVLDGSAVMTTQKQENMC